MLIIIMEATRGQQIVEAVIKVVVGATKEDNQHTKATRCQQIGETVIKVAVATKGINLSSKLKTTEINLQPKETEVEEIMPQIMTIVRRIGVKTDINTTINNETKKENPHPPW